MDKAANFSVTGSDFKVQVSADIHFPALKKNTQAANTHHNWRPLHSIHLSLNQNKVNQDVLSQWKDGC